MTWRLLLSAPLDGPANMALDEALMARARRTGESVLRVYGWSTPVLSFGRNQRARGLYDHAALAERGIGVVRRPTGGRALLHHREITYSVTAPAANADGLRSVYDRVNALLVNALTLLGVPVALARRATRAASPSDLPCFAEPAAGELVVGAQKLVGSAQWRDAGALLQHGSIIVEDDQSLIPSLMTDPGTVRPVPPPATLRAALGRTPSTAEFAGALFTSLRESADPHATELFEDQELRADSAAADARYRDNQWTWRR